MLDLQGIKTWNIETVGKYLQEEDYKLNQNDDLKTAVVVDFMFHFTFIKT